ncbi:MAG: ribonuclease D [Rickettsiales bacterium]|nr:ribonuclease D [Rickettsiales bacterium]
MQIITTQDALITFCDQVSSGDYITVDTEFIRDKTYFPKLCLLQMANDDHAAIIDPLAEGIDLAPVFTLMQNPQIVKVFHAARQDIEIFFLLSGHIPTPIFDTQVAAAVSGFGESVGYESLVNKIVGAEIDKSSRFTDWAARPLTEKQLQYALSDVTHLRVIYKELHQKITETGRMSWLKKEHDFLSNPALYRPDPDNAWKRLKYGNMRPKNVAILRELAKWREIEAREKNVPRGRIIKDDLLIELAHTAPRKESDILRLRSVDKHLPKHKLDAVLAAVNTALELPNTEWPQLPKAKKPPQNITAVVAMLQLLLKVKADMHNIAAPIIASKDDLEAIALGQETPVLQGWRYDIFGKKAQALIEGKLKISLNPKNKQVVFEELE